MLQVTDFWGTLFAAGTFILTLLAFAAVFKKNPTSDSLNEDKSKTP